MCDAAGLFYHSVCRVILFNILDLILVICSGLDVDSPVPKTRIVLGGAFLV